MHLVPARPQVRRPGPWWDGRCVAIRPDVPNLDTTALRLVRGDAERAAVHARIAAAAAAPAWPSWLWEAEDLDEPA